VFNRRKRVAPELGYCHHHQPKGAVSSLSLTLALYTASKHAVEGLTKSAALEAAAFGVRVNAVAPGPTETAMLDRLTGTAEKKATFYAAVPLKRGAKPEEIANAIVFPSQQGVICHRPNPAD
jgi:NAD(P)-dependent dehydrogenase (short-subunit alcohol dehydrogenase family)